MYHQFCAQQEPDVDVHVGPGQCFANETAISNENKRCQSHAESSGLSGFPGDRGSLITVWLEVRILPGPPRFNPPFDFALFFGRIVKPDRKFDSKCSLFGLLHR